MEGDVDAFLEEVRSSEKLLQELQDHLRTVTAETEQLQADVTALRKEQQGLAEESLRNEQELTTISSQTLLQNVRLEKVQNYKTRVKCDLDTAQGDLSNVRERLEGEINEMCAEASKHLAKFGLTGNYLAEAKQAKLDQISTTKVQAEQISLRIKDLQKHENTLKHELKQLADTEREVENKKQCLRQPPQGSARVHDLQQTLCRIGQEQRDGKHLHQLNMEISDAEDETICLRSAVTAMTAELQRLEQLLWFSNMEKMKKRMRANAKCPGQYHCSAATGFSDGNPNAYGAETVKIGPAKTTSPWLGSVSTPPGNEAAANCGAPRASPEVDAANSGAAEAGNEDLAPSRNWPAADVGGPKQNSANLTEDDTQNAKTAAHAARASDGGSAAELARRRWGAYRALMMARRQPAPPPTPPPPPPPPPPASAAPPLASVRPLRRPPVAPHPAETGSMSGRREWGRAAAPGRLSYRGPQPAKRAPDFRTALQQLREQNFAAAATPQKRVRFSADPSQQQQAEDGDEMDDFV